jgi:hypothetical protein
MSSDDTYNAYVQRMKDQKKSPLPRADWEEVKYNRRKPKAKSTSYEDAAKLSSSWMKEKGM